MTLDESIHETKDVVEEVEGIKFAYENRYAEQISDKTIDYHEGPRGGFLITDPGSESQCGGGCC